MSKDISVEWGDDGEVIITKHRDTEDARSTIEAIKRLVDGINKNTDEFTAGAYDEPNGDDDEEDEAELEAELSPRERERRRSRRRLIEAEERAGPARTRKVATMIDSDTLIGQIAKRQLGFVVLKRFAEAGTDELTEAQVTDLLLGEWGREFGKRFQAQDEEGRIAREAVAKARNAQWNAARKAGPTVHATGGRALAFAVQPGKNAERERIINQARTVSPWWTEEELGRYADGLQAELQRAARRKAEAGALEHHV
jgi:hypothetical protein